jgi:hypothetical protein
LALAWKNLAAFVRLGVSLRFLFVGLMMIGSAVVTVLSGNRRGPAGEVTGTLLLMFAGLVTVFGPLLWRFDLRRDLSMLDVLKVYPLRGTAIVTGELLAPLAVLGTATCTFLISGYLALGNGNAQEGSSPTWPVFLSLLVVTVPILLVLLIVQNAAALVFPAWASLGPERATGFEVMGQRLAWMLGTFVGASLMLAPAALAGGFAYLLLSQVVGDLAWVPAALTAAVVVLAESSAAVLWLGRLFERLDPSTAGIA